jgi:hypothetical protein
MTNISTPFTGSIDDLLNQCASIDDKQLDESIELENAIEHVMKETNSSREEAIQLIEEIHLNDVRKTVEDMIAKGLMEITGYANDGEALYGLTERGKQARDEMNK